MCVFVSIITIILYNQRSCCACVNALFVFAGNHFSFFILLILEHEEGDESAYSESDNEVSEEESDDEVEFGNHTYIQYRCCCYCCCYYYRTWFSQD